MYDLCTIDGGTAWFLYFFRSHYNNHIFYSAALNTQLQALYYAYADNLAISLEKM